MEAIKLYGGEADVLYISLGKPREALGIDIGDGVIVRYDGNRREIIGLTILGLRGELERFLKERSGNQGEM